jgi:Flp pilus assembly protein TadG
VDLSRAANRTPQGDRGAAAVEFALVSILLLAILVGIIQFSVWFWSFQVAEHAAREGARRYAVDPCNPGANNALVRSRVGGAAAGAVAVGGTFSGGTPPAAGDDVTVTVTFRVHQIGGGLVPTPDFITQRATSRVEDVEDC